jgi:hypothetical protein
MADPKKLADKLEAELLPRYKLRAADLYGTNASNNAWRNTEYDEHFRSAITMVADWLRAQ